MPHLTVYPDHSTFVNGAVDFVTRCAAKALAAQGQFVIALAGGATPRAIYARLAEADYQQRMDWSKTYVFFSDERCVPPDDERSNFRMAREALLDRVSLPPQNIYRIRGEDDPAQAAFAYEQQLARLFRRTTVPAFDLILLGLGENGHTASLFPGTAALREAQRWVVAQYVEVAGMWRITFTPPLINAAQRVCFLVAGAAKAEIVRQVLQGPYQPEVLPAQLIQPTNGELYWLLDAAAAARI